MTKKLTISRQINGSIWWIDESGPVPQIVANSHSIAGDLPISPEDIEWCITSGALQVEVEMTTPHIEEYGESRDPRGEPEDYGPESEWMIKTDSNGYPVRVKSTTIEKSLAALDRAMDKLGKEGIQEIVDSIPDIPGPTFNQYMANLSNSCPIWRKITDAQIGNGVMLVRNNTNGKTMIGNVYQVKDVYMCNQMVCNEYIAMEVILNLPIEE